MLIIGAKQHAEVIIDTILSNNTNFNIIGCLDDNLDLQESSILGIPVLGTLGDFNLIIEKYNIYSVFIGISANFIKVREKMQNLIFEKKLFRGNAIHKLAFISKKAQIGDGNYFAPYSVINSFAKVGSNCVFYSGAIVEHHCLVGNNVYFGPNTSIAADITIGDNTYIGIGAVIIPHVTVGKNVTIGAGTVVIKDIPDNAVVVGNPGKIIKYNE